MNTNLTQTFARLADNALLEVRAGYFGICVLGGNDQGQWRCGSDTTGIATRYHPQEDPLNLIWAITRFKNGIVFCGLMYVLVYYILCYKILVGSALGRMVSAWLIDVSGSALQQSHLHSSPVVFCRLFPIGMKKQMREVAYAM